MKDIDFDEIDRAVNSVGSNKSVANEKPVDASIEPNKLESSKLASEPSVALAGRRSSGQFMDVVHPSSNMRRAPIKTPERPNNQNVTPSIPPTPDVATPKPTEIELPTPTIPNRGWADSKSDNKDADIDKISDDISSELDHKSDELSDTPFISGTKVEKRPLGAFSIDVPSPEIEPDTDVQNLDENKDDSLPDELQDKLLSIESNESKPEVEPRKEITKPIEKPETPTVERKPAVATSITQQYEEKPSTGDRESGPIYDTNAYHKPLMSPAKKKSSWKIIIWILGILIIGVGAGVLAYYFVRPIL